MAETDSAGSAASISERSAAASKSVGGELWERLQQRPKGDLADRDYLSRYENEDGVPDTDELARHGLNRIFFALDGIGGENEKPVWVHLVTGMIETYIAEASEDGGD